MTPENGLCVKLIKRQLIRLHLAWLRSSAAITAGEIVQAIDFQSLSRKSKEVFLQSSK